MSIDSYSKMHKMQSRKKPALSRFVTQLVADDTNKLKLQEDESYTNLKVSTKKLEPRDPTIPDDPDTFDPNYLAKTSLIK